MINLIEISIKTLLNKANNLGASQIIKIINTHGEEARFVGGCIRDALLNKQINDIDIATTLKPEVLIKLLEKNNIKSIPTGIEHGTITAIINDNPIEITTLRNDLSCNGRHAVIEFTNKWEEDAARRDFTFNALYMDINGKIYDYFDGINDLNKRQLNFVGNPNHRIKEDYLRILRAFRFYTYICVAPLSQSVLSACTNHSNAIQTLSGERISYEMIKLLSYSNALHTLAIMQNAAILKYIFSYHLVIPQNVPNVHGCGLVKLALLIKVSNQPAILEFIKKRWKLSKHQYSTIHHLINCTLDNANMKNNVYNHGKEWYIQTMQLQYLTKKINLEQLQVAEQFAQQWEIPMLPITGNDLIKLGFEPNKTMGETLNHAKLYWQNTDYRASKEDIIEYIKEWK